MEYQQTPALADDQVIVEYYLNGEDKTLETLIYINKEKICNSIMVMVRDRYVADDIFQDVCVRIIDTIMAGKYVEEGKFLPWALRIAHNMCVDHFRKIKQTPERTSKDGELVESGIYFEPQVDHAIITSESHEKIKKMIDMLPEEQREVIVLRHYADLSFKEIADLMKCNINTALGRMRYALINLRRIMEEKQVAV